MNTANSIRQLILEYTQRGERELCLDSELPEIVRKTLEEDGCEIFQDVSGEDVYTLIRW